MAETAEPTKLANAILLSDKKMRRFRQRREMFLRNLAGQYYGDNAVDFDQPLNILFMMASTLEPALVSSRIKTLVSTHRGGIRWFCDHQRLVLNYIAKKVRMARTVRKGARNALFGAGLVKTGYEKGQTLPFVDPISLDDWILDPQCREYDPGGYAFEGHRFRTDYEELMDGGLLKGDAKDALKGVARSQYRPDLDKPAHEIAGKGTWADEESFQPQVELVEVYIPKGHRAVWLPSDLTLVKGKYLREFEPYGPPDVSPYNMLGFSWIPDNAMPLALSAVIFDLFIALNEIANKIINQAKSQKDVGFVDAPSPDAEQAVVDIQDGQFFFGKDVKASMVSLGGANEKGYQAVAWMNDFISRIGGNLNLIGGLTAESKTLGQDQILMGNASLRLADMKAAVIEFSDAIIEKLAWYMWDSPRIEANLSRQIGGMELPVRWMPGNRLGDIGDFEFSIDSYGRGPDTPEEKEMRLRTWVQNYVAPFAPLAAQYGSRPNFDLIANQAGRLLDLDEIDDAWLEGEPLESPANVQVASQGGGAPAPSLTRGAEPQKPVEALATAGETP